MLRGKSIEDEEVFIQREFQAERFACPGAWKYRNCELFGEAVVQSIEEL